MSAEVSEQWDDDPELIDEDDLETQQQLFETLKEGGFLPEEFSNDVQFQEGYRQWLKEHP